MGVKELMKKVTGEVVPNLARYNRFVVASSDCNVDDLYRLCSN